MADEIQPVEPPPRVAIVPEVGMNVRVWQGNLIGAYGLISSIEQGGAYVWIDRNGHEFGELTINLELN